MDQSEMDDAPLVLGKVKGDASPDTGGRKVPVQINNKSIIPSWTS